MQVFIYYLIALGWVAIIDGVWLVFIANKFYKAELGHLLATNPNWIAAILFYLLYPLALVLLAILPGVEAKSLTKTLFNAGVLGFIAYATYDLTNLATLTNWSLKVTIVDIIWGTAMSVLVAFLTYIVINKFSL